MLIGQMLNKSNSESADYFQVDICGKKVEDIIYNLDKKIILHGDWEKKGFSSNDIMNPSRQLEIIDICNHFKNIAYGITIHPPTKKVDIKDFFNTINNIQNKIDIPIFLENRSNSKFLINNIESILAIPKDFNITIDMPQLFINNGYDFDKFKKNIYTLSNLSNIKEIHLGGVKEKRVGQKLTDNLIDYSNFTYFLQNKYITIEILGGKNVFEESKNIILNL